jgi:hypothetical protein
MMIAEQCTDERSRISDERATSSGDGVGRADSLPASNRAAVAGGRSQLRRQDDIDGVVRLSVDYLAAALRQV